MNRPFSSLSKAVVTSVFLVGCAAGVVSREVFSVPKALAQQQQNNQRWEHFCFPENGLDDLRPKLQRAGAEGWELATSSPVGYSMVWCMKRPLP